MAAISERNRGIIKGYIEEFIQGIVDEYKGRVIEKPSTAIEYLSRTSNKG